MIERKYLGIINRLACVGFDSFKSDDGVILAIAELKLFSGTGEFTVEYIDGEHTMTVKFHDGNRWIAGWNIDAPIDGMDRTTFERHIEREVGKIMVQQYKNAKWEPRYETT